MNPSASDWILKFWNLFGKKELVDDYSSGHQFYRQLCEVGFIYGVSVAALPKKPLGNLKLTKEELTKINLFHALLFQFFQKNPNAEYPAAIDDILLFYKNLEKGKSGFFKKFSRAHNAVNNLEHILSARLQAANSPLKKNTVSLLTYALLYLDVLTYAQWQTEPSTVRNYYNQMESLLLTACFYALRSKTKKTKYDHLLIEIFETSPEYIVGLDNGSPDTFWEKLQHESELKALEKRYLLDLCLLTVWEDLELDQGEKQFLEHTLTLLDVPPQTLEEALASLKSFSEKHTEKILLFEYSNPVKQFYKQSAATVKLLIVRNKDRLARELEESGELLLLLGQSTVRDLSSEEKTKVKEQLLDVCKSIPSLTIFLLPGGSVLLPLLIKFIPKLLPSSFQDNRIAHPPRKKE